MKQPEPIRSFHKHGLEVSRGLGALFMIATSMAPNTILSFFTNDTQVLAQGREYLALMRWTFILFPVPIALCGAFAAWKRPLSARAFGGFARAQYLSELYFYIRPLRRPEMGIAGAALATLISRIVEVVIVLAMFSGRQEAEAQTDRPAAF
jgi:Na+-driven multidrug efflux pump